jgi:amidase
MPILARPDGVDHTALDVPYRDPANVRLRDLRVAFFTDNGIVPAGTETVTTVRAAADALSKLTARVDERRPPCIERSYDLEMMLIGPDGGDGLRQFLRDVGSTQTHRLLDEWLAKLEPYRTTLSGFSAYWDTLHEFRAGMHRFLSSYDAILSPVYPHPALPHGTSTLEENFRGFSYTMTHNLTGWPAAVVRCGESSNGLPICVQIAAAPWREDIALALASLIDKGPLPLKEEFS